MRVDGFCIYCGEERLETAEWRKHGTWFVRCKGCGATGPSFARSEEEAIRLFNIRYDAPKQRRLEL